MTTCVVMIAQYITVSMTTCVVMIAVNWLKIAGVALGLLGCVLKRLKILMKSDNAGPVGQNGAKF